MNQMVAEMRKRLAGTGAVVYEEDGRCKVMVRANKREDVESKLPAGVETESEQVLGNVIIEVSGVKNLRG